MTAPGLHKCVARLQDYLGRFQDGVKLALEHRHDVDGVRSVGSGGMVVIGVGCPCGRERRGVGRGFLLPLVVGGKNGDQYLQSSGRR